MRPCVQVATPLCAINGFIDDQVSLSKARGLGGGGGGVGWHSTKFYTRRLRPEVQTITLLYTIFDRKGTPFVYLPQKMVPLSCTYGATFTKLFT